MRTDSEIIRLSLTEPAAFAEIFARHARPVGAYAARRAGQDAGQDILSETFLVAFRRRSMFDQSWDSARPWLLGIASRLIKRHYREEAQQWRSYAASAQRSELTSDAELEDAAARMDAEASIRSLAPLIAGLAGRDRETLLLYAWGDLTYEQVGLALGVPTGTVRSRLNRVRKHLARVGADDAEGAAGNEGGAVNGHVGSRA